MTKSFLKWAGGKSQSLNLISEHCEWIENRLIEPFVGSGVVSLNVPAPFYIIGDTNDDLINVFRVLKENDESFIAEISKYFVDENNKEENYYELRKRFNKTKSDKERASLFIYLNRHCFNGLCRYNRKGEFNVPFGKYKDVYFPSKELLNFKKHLEKCEIYCQDFEDTMRMATKDDVMYCDPPYVPLSETAKFTDYSTDGFGEEQQIKLAKLAEEAPCRVLISNHDTDFTRSIYKNASKIKSKTVGRMISADGSKRKSVKELLAIYE